MEKLATEKKWSNSPERPRIFRPERRIAVRYPWTSFDGMVIIPNDQREIKVKPHDVSETGLSFSSLELIACGDIVLFICNQRAIRVEVVWMEATESEDLFRYGLKRVNDSHNLTEIFLDDAPKKF